MSEPTLSFAVQTHRVQFVVPSELIKKNIKIIQKQIEKSKKLVTEEISRIKKCSLLTAAEKLASVKRLIKVYDHHHKKLAMAVQKDQDYRLRLAYRAERLSELKNYTVRARGGSEKVLDLHNESLISWYRDETNLLIVDYLLKSNVKKDVNFGLEVLEKLELRSRLSFSKLIDHDVYSSYNRVHRSIREDHDLEAISTWYNDNRTALKKVGSNLLFEIHYCKYLSLIESGDPFQATAYSKKYLAPYARRENYGHNEDEIFVKNRDRLTRLGSLLVCISSLSMSAETLQNLSPPPGSLIASLLSQLVVAQPGELNHYNRILTEEYWQGLSECFTKDYTKVYGIPQTYPLFVYLSAGLSSLKTKSCFCNRQNTIFEAGKCDGVLDNLDSSSLRDLSLRGPNQYYKLLQKINQCPVCSPELYSLSQTLPYAQLITSIYNNPFKLPNGNIYPFDKLLNPEGKFERDNLVRNGKVRDPLTHEIFFIDDCVRVFPA
ncbi:hypothetical protein METBIDRAFT_46353 [Metschnikowia bicuspidata var. bicuspidata NRRL YB-4993]|uniref:RING-Gid-type domain-containing protein n=1 Tax=Metschnikowia bicuspidata var. bicuspidata NRRL YB-4993 TaxID=869754 RepID=A0A1A0H6J1_9ASCO|nr:hypothetical protein METBIDRAFT_46353 [Metschnikowia bicuspidata var. bicuspidata NRRL YB-4993]OBA19651.1 hypothetical protein METBIDRAFT_46353 [Metschnikowia bicuspidata var. bicuspidata NRRL YB-4993]